MYNSFALIALSILCLSCSTQGFSVSPVALSRPIISFTDRSSSTCLFAEDKAEETQGAETAAGDDNASAAWTPPNDILSSPAFLQRKLEVIKSDIAKVDDEITATKAKLEEGKAEWAHQFEALENEFQNIQNRFSRQGSKGDEDATLTVSREMLQVLDNYDRAFKTLTPETEEDKAIEARYKETYDNIIRILMDLGVTEIETVGKEFDYEFHQAVMQRAHEDFEEGIVCEELQKGFVLNGKRLVRAAMVSVAA